jgi:TetR/AcrR family transcriptional regulator of autoinduction and epiphytic fitness
MSNSTAPNEEQNPPAQSRVQRKRNRRIQEILRAAAQVLADTGYHALSMEKVADVLDLSKASLYHYFPSKDALVDAAISEIADETIERLSQQANAGHSSTERLGLLIADQLRILLFDYPEVAQLFAEHSDWPEVHRAQAKSMRLRHDRLFRTVVEEGIAAGEFRPPSPDTALHCLHGALNYAAVWARNKRDREQQITEITDTVMLMFTGAGAVDGAVAPRTSPEPGTRPRKRE